MIHYIKNHLGIKLLLMLALVIIMAIAPLVYTALRSLKQYGNEAAILNEQQIRSQASGFLLEITREKANGYQQFFDRVAASASLLGKQASAIYANLSLYAEKPYEKSTLTLSPDNNIFSSDITEPLVTLYWGGENILPPIKEEIDALSHMTPLYQQVLQDNPEGLASHVITTSGIGKYCSRSDTSKRAALSLPPVSTFDLRDGIPMTIFTKVADRPQNVQWTDIYKDDVIEGFMLTASAPIFDNNNIFRGITGIDVPLDTIIDDVLDYGEDFPYSDILFSFLLDTDGKIIALADEFLPLFGLSLNPSAYDHSDDRPNLSFELSDEPAVANLALLLKEQQESFTSIYLAGDPYYIASSRLAKLGWVFGIVIREDDLFAPLKKNQEILEETIINFQWKGLILSTFSVITAIIVVFVLLKYLITPLRDLAQATRRVSEGDLSVRSNITSSDEVGVLAASFNEMVNRLEAIQWDQSSYAQALKQEVEESNIELSSKKHELNAAITLMKREIEKRQIIAEALRNSQKQYYDTLESTKAGVFIIENNFLTYANKAFAEEIFKIPQEELNGYDPLQLIVEEDRKIASRNMQRRFDGEEIPPYTMRCIRGDGSHFYGEIWAKISEWQGKKVLVGTVSDVTHYKENEALLAKQENQLQKSLEEKEVLLKEIYHRTKNNMLVIISMLDLQAQEIDDERVRTVFRETEDRIRAMALVHEKLYQSQDLSNLDIGGYLIELCQSMLGSMVLEKKIELESAISPVKVNIDYAVPLGLVVSEIVTNSIKHGFKERERGTIFIGVEKDRDGTIGLTIGDDGVGLPDEVDLATSSSFGMGIIIASLVKGQLRGEITIDRKNGTTYHIRFSQPQTVPRV